MGKKLEREKRLEQEAVRHWEEIMLGDFVYDRCVRHMHDVCCGRAGGCAGMGHIILPTDRENRPQQEAAALKTLTKADISAFYDTYIRCVCRGQIEASLLLTSASSSPPVPHHTQHRRPRP